MTRSAVLRLMDANANRALEGIRVCEEVVRFQYHAPALFRRLRALRHAITGGVRALPIDSTALVRARDSRRDPGRRTRTCAVHSLEHLVVINLQRTKEALRTLEECTRLLSPRHTPAFQRLRFRTYDLERDLLLKLMAAVRHR